LTIAGEITLGSAIVSKPIGTSISIGASWFCFIYCFGITNAAVSTITGNIGSESGSIIGFELATVNGAFATNATYQ
jgi:hypothetical protein